MTFVISKPVNHGFTVLLGHDSEATRIAREALDKVEKVYLVHEGSYDGSIIYGVFTRLSDAEAIVKKVNDEAYDQYLEVGSPWEQEVRNRESNVRMVKRKRKSARGLHELEHAENQLKNAQDALAQENWKPIPRDKYYKYCDIRELTLDEELVGEYL